MSNNIIRGQERRTTNKWNSKTYPKKNDHVKD